MACVLVPTSCVKAASEYHFQLAPVPKLPPVCVRVTCVPAQIGVAEALMLVGATVTWLIVTATVAVPGTFGQPVPPGVLVVIVRVALPLLIEGVKVALTVVGLVPDVTIFEKLPLVDGETDQVPEVAAPINVPVTVIEPSEQTS